MLSLAKVSRGNALTIARLLKLKQVLHNMHYYSLHYDKIECTVKLTVIEYNSLNGTYCNRKMLIPKARCNFVNIISSALLKILRCPGSYHCNMMEKNPTEFIKRIDLNLPTALNYAGCFVA